MLVPQIEADSCSLRSITEADVSERYLAWLQDPEVNRYLETRWSPQSLDSIRAFVRTQAAAPDSFLFAIEVEGTHIGNIKLGPVNPHHECADVSYFIGDRAYWGRGIATRAIRAVVRFGFEQLHLNRVQAGVYASNVGSIKALEKAGFVREGVWRRQLRGPEGFEDHLFFGVLRQEWKP